METGIIETLRNVWNFSTKLGLKIQVLYHITPQQLSRLFLFRFCENFGARSSWCGCFGLHVDTQVIDWSYCKLLPRVACFFVVPGAKVLAKSKQEKPRKLLEAFYTYSD